MVSYAQFVGRVNQTANMLVDLGVGPGDAVSFMLPLLPQSFFTLFGAEVVGIANPVNPLLEPGQIAEILRAAGTRVLVALGPVWRPRRICTRYGSLAAPDRPLSPPMPSIGPWPTAWT